ncbi:MAG TPA: lysoplasmalogenase [Qipengyuania sp.]|nr:lysoplasmalogenase [Qipengyuania sp.]
MPRRALIDHRPWLLASLAASISYFFFRDNPVPGLYLIAWKGAAVAFLAVYAARRGRGVDGWLLTAVMALGALGDMVLELSMMWGGALFALGHLVAIVLFLRNPRERRTASQVLAAFALLLGTPLVAALLAMPDPRWPLAAGYAAIVGAMAAVAWISRFPRYRVGIGAVMFVASDLLIFAGEREHVPETVTWWLIWPLYYAGQLLIATGVIGTLRNRPG